MRPQKVVESLTETSNLQPLGSGCCTGLNWLMNYVTHTVRTLGPEKSKSQAHSNLVIFICPKRPDVTWKFAQC